LDDTKKVAELIKTSVDVNIHNFMGTTALHHAASINSISMVRLLLEHGAKSVHDSTGKFPEDWASDPEVIKSLQDFIDKRLCPNLKEARIGMGMCPGRVWHDWYRDLDSDLQVIRNHQINVIASIITNTELKQMNYFDYYDRIRKSNLESLELSIHDKWLPNSVENFMKVVTSILEHVHNDKTVLVHCNGGRGRTGLVVSACILNLGYPIDQAIQIVRTARTGMLRNPAQEIFLRSLVFKPIDSILKLSPRQTMPKINLENPNPNILSQSNSTPRLNLNFPVPKSTSPRGSKPGTPRKKTILSPREIIQSIISPNPVSEINHPSINSSLLDVGASGEIPIDLSFSPVFIISEPND